MQKKKQSYFIWSVWPNASLLWKSRTRFCAVVSRQMQSFKGFGENLLKLELFKDKTLVRISVLQHIHHENRPISSAFNARRK